jgi:hypothetical protein
LIGPLELRKGYFDGRNGVITHEVGIRYWGNSDLCSQYAKSNISQLEDVWLSDAILRRHIYLESVVAVVDKNWHLLGNTGVLYDSHKNVGNHKEFF